MNSISTPRLARIIAATLKERLPAASFCNQNLSQLLNEGSGRRVSVLAPFFGRPGIGAGITAADLAVYRDTINVDLYQHRTGISINALEKAIEIGNFREAIDQPLMIGLAAQINRTIAIAALGGSQHSVVGQASFATLDDGISFVRKSRVNDGDVHGGLLDPITAASIRKTGLNRFANPRLTDDLYDEGVIEYYGGANWIETADLPTISYGTTISGGSTSSFTATGNLGTANINGAKTLQLSGIVATDGSSNISAIIAGTPLNIAGWNSCDVVTQRDTGLARDFKVMYNPATADGSWPVTAGSVTVAISEVKVVGQVNPNAGLNGDPSTGTMGALWAVPNTIQSSTITPSTTVICPLVSGGIYTTGVVFAKNSVMLASRQAAKIGWDSASSSLDGEINVTMSRQSTVDMTNTYASSGQETMRFDTLVGVSPAYTQGACGIYNLQNPGLGL